MRRKGERPIPQRLDTWSSQHPVAHAIATGSRWFDSWLCQKATPIEKLARKTGMSRARLLAIAMGDRLSRAEADALSIAWAISTNDLIASMPDPAMVID